MSIHPFRLDSVSADNCTTLQLEACRTELHHPFVHVAQNILFAGAECTRATLSQKLERKIAFQLVGPSQRELVADHGHIFQARLHDSILAIFAKGNKLRRRSVLALLSFGGTRLDASPIRQYVLPAAH